MHQIKKITLLISSLSGGGAEGVCVNIANHLSANGWKVDLLVLNLKNEVYLDRISEKINLIVLGVNHARYSIVPLLKYLFKKKENSYLVFNHELTVILVILRIIFNLKIKIIARNISILSLKINQFKKKGIWENYVIRPLIKYFYQKIDHVINQCHSMRNDLIKIYPKLQNNSSVIYNPVSSHVDDYSKKYDLTKVKKKNYILCVGRLEQVKAFHFALQGFVKLITKFPSLRLKIVGQGSLDYDLKQKAIDFGIENRVDFEGFKKDVIPYYLHAKATILTSLYEGYPNVLIESLALNTPVVAFNCPGGTNEIVQDGLNGYLVKFQDVDDLESKISNILLKKFDYVNLKDSIKKNQIYNICKNYEKLII